MPCTKTGINLSIDVDNRLQSSIDFVSEHSNFPADILASFFKDTKFIEFLTDEIGDKSPSEANQNTIRKLLRQWYIITHPRVDNTSANIHGDFLEGFSSSKAKSLALANTAEIFTRFDIINNRLPSTKKVTKEEIPSKVIRQVKDDYINNVAVPAYRDYLLNGGKSIDELTNLLALEKKTFAWLNEFRKANNNRVPKDKIAEYQKQTSLYRSLQPRKLALLNDFIKKHGNLREKNYANYVTQVTTNSVKWFEQALSLKKALSIAKKYGYTLTSEDLSDLVDNDDFNEINEDSEGLNEESRRYLDDIDKYKSFTQLVSDEFRTYLSTLVNLNAVYDGTSNPSIDTDNELGVSTSMNPGYIINVLTSRCDFASGIDGLIKSIDTLISSKRNLYGVSIMTAKMKKDRNFANKVFHNLAHPVATKTMITLENDIMSFGRSNENAEPALNLLYTTTNQFKSTVFNNFDISDKDTINTLQSKLNKTNGVANAERFIKQFLVKYFPGIDINVINTYINTTDKAERLKSLLNIIRDIDVAAQSIVNQRNTKKFADINFDVALNRISSLTKLLLPYISVNTELNSPNAKGNMSSDLINNNAITNLIKQINFGTEEDAEIGIKRLMDVVTSCRQYDNSPIFYGVYDNEGNELYPGLFKRIDGKVVVNDKAKQVIRFSLFNGITNPNTEEGEVYSGMSKADYFVSSLIAFNKVYKDRNNYELTFKDAGYFLRVPSDAPKNFIIHAPKIEYNGLLTNGTVNRNHGLFLAFKQVLTGEITTLIHNLNNVFEKKGNKWVVKKDTRGLFDLYLHKKGKIFDDESGRLLGNAFGIIRLHATEAFNAPKVIEDILSLYGGVTKALINKDGSLNLERTDLIREDVDNNRIIPNINQELYDSQINDFVDTWIQSVVDEALKSKSQFDAIIEDRFSDDAIIDMVLNTDLAYMNFDDLFEGDSKFYKDAQNFLKRAKEVQAGGEAYANWSVSDKLCDNIINITDENNTPITFNIAGKTINARNGFRAITIKNTINPSTEANNIKAHLLEQGVTPETAKDIAERFGLDKDFGDGTTVNDAQSYITIEEFANRAFAIGELDEYKELLDKLMSDAELNVDDWKDVAALGKKIQVQKNFYFDKQVDAATGLMHPRQIKNAEFVLIPQLLDKDSSLYKLYQMMRKHDIGQVNTAETDKAAKRYILEFWDNKSEVSQEAIDNIDLELTNGAAIENYYYRYLYRQQQVAEHMVNEENKAGIQIMKKIIDNAANYSENVQNAVNTLFDNYVDNIRLSYEEMMDSMGWKIDANGRVVNQDDSTILNFTEFYKRGKEEAKRLGMDSNFLAYFDTDEEGHAILPNFMSVVQSKLESIAQSIFNSSVTRQKLPGWHAAQITNVGFDNKLGYHKDNSAIAEIRLTPWFSDSSITLEELAELGLDEMIIYRIPTEGKQSISVAKVTELLNPIQGSTVVVPDEWVTQTGSDFDVDSVYGISFKFKRNKETGKLELIQDGRDGNNNRILKAMIDIMKDPSVLEENLSCSNFDEIADNIKYFNDINPLINTTNQSCYNIFDQMTFMENATSGMALKAASVIRDNFNSINSYVKSELNPNNAIKVVYNLKDYNIDDITSAYDNVDTTTKPGYAIVTHNRLANSKNNRNVKGRLITVYSSQTTAHILDAIKTGAIFNENMYTFGSFKTLIDLGIDYKTAIAFLQQPAVTMIVENYNRNKSIYANSNNYDTKPIHDAIKDIARLLSIKVTDYTSMSEVRSSLLANKSLRNSFIKLFGADLSFDDNVTYNFITLDVESLEKRLKQGKISNNSEINTIDNIAYDLGMVLFFDQLKRTTDGIENIAKVSNPDKFGAKQTVASTRDKIETIHSILNNKRTKGYDLLKISKTDFLEAIYPGATLMYEHGIVKDTINVERSAYKYLAAFLKYATIPSINVNKQLFSLESDNITNLLNSLQSVIGKKLNEAQLKEYKEYVVANVYANVEEFTRPITIDDNGRFVYDIEREKRYSNETNAPYWDVEYRRIRGYRTVNDYNYDIENLNNPTDKDIDTFKELTPIQKILFIKKHFTGDAGIFNYLETNVYKQESTIRYKDVTDDIETLYKLMNEAFFNKNKFIRLAAYDLIKYAYLIENGKFKKGYISKLITKEMLLAPNNRYGNDLVNAIQDAFNKTNYNVIEKFVRSHHGILTSIKKTKNNPIDRHINNGVYIIPMSDKAATDFIRYYKGSKKEYVKLNYKNEFDVNVTRLYHVETIADNVIMTPLNLLDNNETTEYSVNPINNVFKTPTYYQAIVDNEFGIIPDSVLSEINASINDYRIKNIIKNSATINENAIQEQLDSNSPVKKQEAANIITDIVALYNSPVKGDNLGIITSTSFLLNNLTKSGAVRQKLIIDDIERTVAISKVKSQRLYNVLKLEDNATDKDINSLSEAEQDVYYKARQRGEQRPFLYGVVNISDKQLLQEKLIANDVNDMASATPFVDSETFEVVEPTIYDTFGEKILSDIFYAKKYNDNSIIDSIIDSLNSNKINAKSIESIHKNIETIFKIANNFYTKRGVELLNRADKFITINGTEYSIDDKALYENLQEEDAEILIKLLLDMKKFANSIKDIMDLQPTSDNLNIQNSINSIQGIISRVVNSPKINKGFEYIFDIYFAKMSTNPMIRKGYIKLRQAFGDIDWFDRNISDIGELNNSQAQVIVNYINKKLKTVETSLIPKAVEAFQSEYDSIMSEDGSFNIDNIIDKNGYLIRDYTDEYFNARKELYNRVKEIETNQGTNNIEYYKAKLELDKWLTKNTHRRIKQDYYEAVNDITEKVINEAPDLYVKYMELQDRLHNLNINAEFDNDNLINRRKDILNEISQLASIYNEDLTEKDNDSKTKAQVLAKFIKDKQSLNEKVFTRVASEEFNDKFEYHKRIIERYDAKYPNRSLALKLNDENYANSYNWIQNNTIKELNKNTRDILNKAFAELKSDTTETPNYVKHILKGKDVYDANGNIDPLKISLEDARAIKAAKERQLPVNGTERLMKNVPDNTPIATQTWYDQINNLSGNTENTSRNLVIKEINDILKKVCKTGKDITSVNIMKLSDVDLKRLETLYFELQHPSTKGNGNKEVAEFIKNTSKLQYDEANFNAELNYYLTNIVGTKYQSVWLNIFVQRDKNGDYVEKDNSLVPNMQIFGYRVPNNKYRNTQREEARKIINDNVQWELTDKYFEAQDKAYLDDNYNEWYEANHYFNPITNRSEPLPYWTKMKINPNGTLDATYEQAPTKVNTKSEIKEDYINPKYDKNSKVNYNNETGSYNATTNLSNKERKIRDLFQRVLDESATNSRMKKAAEVGFMPREAKVNADAAFWTKQAFGVFGLGYDTRQPEWTYDIEYGSEKDVEPPMLQLLKSKGYQPIPAKPTLKPGQTTEQYNAELAEWETKAKEIRDNNIKLDNDIRDNNWRDVMTKYITRATMYNEKRRLRNVAHLMIEDFKDSSAIKLNWRGKPSVKSKTTTDTETEYNTEKFDNLTTLVENWYHRVFRDEFKKKNKFNAAASLFQNVTSAKYMIFNVTGGIANLLTGYNNILGEKLAGEYFDRQTWRKAFGEYSSNMINMIANQYSETSISLIDGIIKLANVVDFDAMVERGISSGVSEKTKRVRDKFYFMQSGGEHIMQNTVLIAMLHSHRLYTDSSTGKIVVGTFEQFIRQQEEDAFKSLIQNDSVLLSAYDNFKSKIKYDTNAQFEYGTFRKNIINDFIKQFGNKELQAKFNAKIKDVRKAAKETYNSFDSVYNQFKLDKGKAVIKTDSLLTDEMFSEIITKTISVNKRIHGVYDKIGAAYIESHWWGTLVMQYHKHLYPGIMKRWRRNGYYNEARGTIEKGSYQSLFDLTIQGYRDAIENNKDIDNVVKRSIMNICQGTYNLIMDTKFNYQSMPTWERANVRRALADHFAALAGILFAIALHAGFDDDDFKENNFLATLLYQSDRLVTESLELHPLGIPAAIKTTYSSPIASLNGPQDFKKTVEILNSLIFDDDYDINYTTGRYKGQNKLLTMLGRNIPIYRIYDRLSGMGQSNKYYRIGDNGLGIIPVKKIGNYIQGEN